MVRTFMIAAVTAVALTAPGLAQEPKFKALSVKTPDGLTISAQELGQPERARNPLHPRLLTKSSCRGSSRSPQRPRQGIPHGDLRPARPRQFRQAVRAGALPNLKSWGDEVQAVMDAAGFKRAVLVGWSYAGRVMADYLTNHGTAKLAGLNYVDAGQKGDPTFVGPNLHNLPLMASEDLATNIVATRVFLHGCFYVQPTQDEYETMLAFNMMVPPKVRLGLSGRPLEVDDLLNSMNLPVLVTHGALDRNSNLIAAEYTAKMIPGAKLSVYQGVGHSPFFEDAPRFNAELAAFVRSAQKVN